MTWAVEVMLGFKQIGHFRELSNYREFLIHALETNTPMPHVVHKNPIE